ncbi:response regulator transcription factor [Oribacterium sinus]|uniref:response regulator transcription factor n=1 Tax=Oribacterium sinus TaxID=237576 RepID=UPI0028E6C08D|nr:response regulator [Oribacterium sinus]
MRVLIADDEERICELIKFLGDFQEEGMECLPFAKTGKEALERVEKELPELLITDIKMPVFSGLHIAKEIARKKLPTKVIIVSAYSDFSYAKEGIQAGVSDYLLKPIKKKELQESIRKIKEELKEKESIAEIIEEKAEETIMHQGILREKSLSESSLEKKVMEDLLLDAPYSHLVSLSKKFIDQCFEEDIGLEEVAEHCKVSASYLSTQFKKELSLGVNKYISGLRMERAKQLLAETNLSITEIASRLFYYDTKYFSKCFFEKMGMNPKDYRNSLHENRSEEDRI